MSKLFLLGSPYWCRYLQLHLAQKNVDAHHILHRPRHLMRIFSDRHATLLLVGFGASLTIKRAILWFVVLSWWLLHRRKGSVVHYWIGSDVARVEEGSANRLLISFLSRIRARHICGAPWFAETLRRVGIEAAPVLFPYDTDPAAARPSTASPPPPLRAMAYLTPGSWRNMNGDRILRLAELVQNVQWEVVGMSGSDFPLNKTPSRNVHFLGWVDDPLTVMAACHVFVRLANHDAYSGMVRDAQMMGKTVLYTKPVRGCINVSGRTADEVANILISITNSLTHSSEEAIDFRHNDLIFPSFNQQIANLVGALDIRAQK